MVYMAHVLRVSGQTLAQTLTLQHSTTSNQQLPLQAEAIHLQEAGMSQLGLWRTDPVLTMAIKPGEVAWNLCLLWIVCLLPKGEGKPV